MSVGDNTEISVIWVPGETVGHHPDGSAVTVPPSGGGALADAGDAATLVSAKAYTDALHTKLTSSGILP